MSAPRPCQHVLSFILLVSAILIGVKWNLKVVPVGISQEDWVTLLKLLRRGCGQHLPLPRPLFCSAVCQCCREPCCDDPLPFSLFLSTSFPANLSSNKMDKGKGVSPFYTGSIVLEAAGTAVLSPCQLFLLSVSYSLYIQWPTAGHGTGTKLSLIWAQTQLAWLSRSHIQLLILSPSYIPCIC